MIYIVLITGIVLLFIFGSEHDDTSSSVIPPIDVSFTAFDFETLNESKLSACMLGITTVDKGTIVRSRKWMIKPPIEVSENQFSHLHGVKYEHLKNAKTWDIVWQEAKPFFIDKNIITHDYYFQLGILDELMDYYEIATPRFNLASSKKWARSLLPEELESYKLHDMAEDLYPQHIPYDAESDSYLIARLALLCAHYSRTTGFNNIVNKSFETPNTWYL